jgi:Xaa-Pro aminopeptidase
VVIVSLKAGPSIVGAGNSCFLHYIENSKMKVEKFGLNGLGAEYHGYTADVTEQSQPMEIFRAETNL